MRLIIVSNRAPVNIVNDNGRYRYEESSGGLASGLRAFMERMKKTHPTDSDIIWIGWPGTVSGDEKKIGADLLKKFGVQSVFLSEQVMEKFYEGFCNKTIWPLFHYFPGLTVYEKEFWEQYVSVNETYCNAVLDILRPGDIIWIHDYHLMLLPAMLRKKAASATIGFFLHIPFPSYEVFRLLPSEWRKQIMEGLYGADLVGFHTHDYCTHFLRSTLRILGIPHHMGEVYIHNRLVKVDTFPMGIDYDKYHDAVSDKDTKAEKAKLHKHLSSVKLILSIDRQDYSKGILNRLSGFQYLLETNPQWRGHVTMMMVIIPSRIGVESYQSTKSKIDELVGSINSRYGNFEWMPIIYQYRSLAFHELMALYNSSDVALVTPLRDGMNLIAKEYIASRTNNKGVLILSEMAGAVDELDESLIINPNNIEEIGNSLLESLEMKEAEQSRRIAVMQQRIKSYDVFKWADDFLTTLDTLKKKQLRLGAKMINSNARKKMIEQYRRASSRVFFLDYDGTLVPHEMNPADAIPSKKLLDLLEKLSEAENTRVVLISGRDKMTLEEWFGHLPLDLAAEHGLLLKERNKKWRLLKPVRRNWKKRIIPVLNQFAERLPGAFVEEKEFSVAFHYRRSDPLFASLRVRELANYMMSFTANMDVQLLNGNKALEIRNAGIDKGVAAMHWLAKGKKNSRFILSIGDDWTDEDLFRVMPKEAYSIKIGFQPSYAMFNVHNPPEVLELLSCFV